MPISGESEWLQLTNGDWSVVIWPIVYAHWLAEVTSQQKLDEANG